MVIQEDLIYFLKNGRLKNINFGITREQLFEVLGEPQSTELNKTKWNSMLYLYENNFEFYFDDSVKDARLRFIQINCLDKYANDSIKFKEYGWTFNLTFDEAITFLEDNKVEFEEKPYPLADDVRILVTESGVKIAFSNWGGDTTFKLSKFGRSIEFKGPQGFL